MKQKDTVDSILNLLMWIMFLIGGVALFFYSADMVAITFFVLGCWFRIFLEREILVHFVKTKLIIWTWGAVFSGGYFFAEKYLNFRFQIEPDYLNTSPWIASILFSILFSFILLEIIVFIAFGLSLFMGKKEIIFAWDRVVKKKKIESIALTLCCTFFGFFPLVVGLAVVETKILMVSLRMDSYAVSDCGKIEPSVSYLRKNENYCYKFEPWFDLSYPKEIESKKGS
ncbi:MULTISPECIES: hypothetical protein [Providencia]|uniref:hypothetical protein n=1 Tax=Providencia TaxID=586 RepID=UPI0008FB07D7|nr:MULTISPECIES: hypothetical protein [Providencia]APC12866.1 hypothetical protein RB151_032080 [Providencia rettgeri]EKH6496152.1 hypothetical protein [Providencia rettgeri]ELR5053137.1 hypothetical protein [Providencia rettgeri]ELR5155375.1 hypothetical protein [Providencia rettgeri]ELR5181530.1 hypothetical protein [Providencia rettgeri]